MKEKEFIEIIKSTLNSEYIGDDCAYLKSLGIVITQDSLVEDVHFKMDYMTPYQLGYKSVMVNISDICASGAEPKYLTIALSLPNYVNEKFVEEFYKGAKEASGDVKIVGGDLTGGEKVFISVTAIGATKNRKISSQLSKQKANNVVATGADYVLTTCPACIIGIKRGLLGIKSAPKVLSLSDFLAKADKIIY